jgi:hypothetical protein
MSSKGLFLILNSFMDHGSIIHARHDLVMMPYELFDYDVLLNGMV